MVVVVAAAAHRRVLRECGAARKRRAAGKNPTAVSVGAGRGRAGRGGPAAMHGPNRGRGCEGWRRSAPALVSIIHIGRISIISRFRAALAAIAPDPQDQTLIGNQ